jgi:hypothetical protein
MHTEIIRGGPRLRRIPEGELTLSGTFLAAQRNEIINLARNTQ